MNGQKNKPASIPFFVHEMVMTRMERINKRMAWACFAGWVTTALSVAAAIIW